MMLKISETDKKNQSVDALSPLRGTPSYIGGSLKEGRAKNGRNDCTKMMVFKLLKQAI